MKHWWVLPLTLLLAGPVQAASSENPALGYATQLSLQDYFFVFIGGVLLLNLAIILWRTFFRPAPQKQQSPLVTASGSFLAILFVGMGSLVLFLAILSLFSAMMGITLFDWIVVLLVQYAGSITVGILGLGVIGTVLFLLGAYNLFLLQSSPFWKSLESPQRTGFPEKHDLGGEDWTPRLRLKVVERNHNTPASNKRVILRAGERYFSRYTNTEGEVEFTSLKGHMADYYAFVDGDENRALYQLIHLDT